MLFPDTLAPRAYQEALPPADEGNVLDQQADAGGPDDDEDEPRD